MKQIYEKSQDIAGHLAPLTAKDTQMSAMREQEKAAHFQAKNPGFLKLPPQARIF